MCVHVDYEWCVLCIVANHDIIAKCNGKANFCCNEWRVKFCAVCNVWY